MKNKTISEKIEEIERCILGENSLLRTQLEQLLPSSQPIKEDNKKEGETIMKCGQETEIYSRVVGYFRPVSNWNKGKREEFRGRKVFKTKK